MPRKKEASKPKQPRQSGNNGGGRRKKWEELEMPSKLEIVEGWARNGAIDTDICKALGIGRDLFYQWKKEYPEFTAAVSRGKEIADIQVESALFRKALGYKYDEVTQEMGVVFVDGDIKKDDEGNPVRELQVVKVVTKEVAPDTTAQIFWLKNRKPQLWRDTKNIDHSGNITGGLSYMSDEEVKAELEKMRGKNG